MRISIQNRSNFSVLYSAKAASLYGSNRAINCDGDEVEYTCIWDEVEHGNWRGQYNWDDVEERGHITSYDQITQFGFKPLPEYQNHE